MRSRWDYLKTNMFDSYDPVKNLQRKMTGVEGNVKGLNKAFQTEMEKSPMLLPYFQFRLTAASNARAEGMINYGVFFSGRIFSRIVAKSIYGLGI